MVILAKRRAMADDSGLSLTVGVGVHSLLLSLMGRTLHKDRDSLHKK